MLGAAATAALGYVGFLKFEVDHYRTKAADLELELSTAKAAQKKEEERLYLAYDAINRKFADSLRQKGEAIQKGYDEIVKRIKAHEPSKRIVIEPDVVELFNATKPETPSGSPPTEPENARKAAADQATLRKTLNDLLLVSAENDKNHQVCIEQVLEWQQFWEDYKNARTPRHPD